MTAPAYPPLGTNSPQAALATCDHVLILLSWEAGLLDIDAACRVLNVSREELLDMEVEAIQRGLALVAGDVRTHLTRCAATGEANGREMDTES